MVSKQISEQKRRKGKRTNEMCRKKRPKMHAARNIFTPGATPRWTALSHPKFSGVAPGV
jgi:hypothetical protein